MGPLEDFTYATFAERLGEPFRVVSKGEARPVELTLAEATELAPAPGLEYARPPFSIVFRGPAESPLPQGTQRFDNDVLGTFEMFIVPIGADDDGLTYEAIFT
jgi:hypothetical protein